MFQHFGDRPDYLKTFTDILNCPVDVQAWADPRFSHLQRFGWIKQFIAQYAPSMRGAIHTVEDLFIT